MNVTVHQNGYLCLVVEDNMYHVVVILVRMVEHVNLLLEEITFVFVLKVSFENIASCLTDLHSN